MHKELHSVYICVVGIVAFVIFFQGLRAEVVSTAGQLSASSDEVGKLKLENEQLVRVVAEGKNEAASLQAQLANADRGNEQLLLLQKDLADKDGKIQVPKFKLVLVHAHK